MKLTYTNADLLLSKIMELKDYLDNEKPNVMWIAETKLSDNVKCMTGKLLVIMGLGLH